MYCVLWKYSNTSSNVITYLLGKLCFKYERAACLHIILYINYFHTCVRVWFYFTFSSLISLCYCSYGAAGLTDVHPGAVFERDTLRAWWLFGVWGRGRGGQQGSFSPLPHLVTIFCQPGEAITCQKVKVNHSTSYCMVEPNHLWNELNEWHWK